MQLFQNKSNMGINLNGRVVFSCVQSLAAQFTVLTSHGGSQTHVWSHPSVTATAAVSQMNSSSVCVYSPTPAKYSWVFSGTLPVPSCIQPTGACLRCGHTSTASVSTVNDKWMSPSSSELGMFSCRCVCVSRFSAHCLPPNWQPCNICGEPQEGNDTGAWLVDRTLVFIRLMRSAGVCVCLRPECSHECSSCVWGFPSSLCTYLSLCSYLRLNISCTCDRV